ncbi:RNA polymerase sigma-70 factor [Bacteroidota bacterium]
MLREGDEGSLKNLFDAYYKDLVIHSMKMVINLGVAEEIVQDVFIQLWNNRHIFILKKTFRNYLFTSVKNRSINYLKSKYGKLRFDDLDLVIPPQSHNSPDEKILLDEMREEIKNAIGELPPKCRIIFNLSRNAGMSTDEIAAHLGLSKKTIQAQITIAVGKIKAHLGDRLDPLF